VWLSYAWLPYAFAASLWSHLLTFISGGGGKPPNGLPWLSAPRMPGLRWKKKPDGEPPEGRRWAS
jgi:hypothetical protein